MAERLPGVKVGPLDPDRTEKFGRAGEPELPVRTLIRLHSQSFPPQLTRALALKRDDERTLGLDMAEVREYVGGLKRENGDPILPEGARVTGATVRGERDRDQVLCFTFEIESGRSGKWFAAYDREALPTSAESGDELVKVKEMKDRGIVEFDREGTRTQVQFRELGALRRENAALRRQAEARGTPEEVDLGPEGDTRPDLSIVAENEQLRRQTQELTARLDALEAALGEKASREAFGTGDEAETLTAAQDAPVEGYDDLKADDAIKTFKREDLSDEQKAELLEHERSHRNRASVVRAGEESLGRTA